MTARLSLGIHRLVRLNRLARLWALNPQSQEKYLKQLAVLQTVRLLKYLHRGTRPCHWHLALLYLLINNCQVPLACCQLRFVKNVHHRMFRAKPIQ